MNAGVQTALRELEQQTGVVIATAPVDGEGVAASRNAGRTAARCAFGRAGAPEQRVLGREPDGRPRWPDGWTGSITHDRDLAVAAVGRLATHRAVGVDIERDSALTVADAELVLRDEEVEWARTQEHPANAATLLWSAKESAFKAWATASGGLHGVDPTDIHIVVTPESHALRAVAVGALRNAPFTRPLDGAFAIATGKIVTVLVHRA